ncbi:TPX2 family protein, putative isoform 1 [Hibiscus syriacus]|uniref:TPX2 family protein, putative isoform 1 n=1 Tax=Hibiscus syriacus TaxID=106335 RepID=A0A6A3A4B9_HIBSY|nr:TPX2 family protein, putative isoform 1 [Hibiscus syriacus]
MGAEAVAATGGVVEAQKKDRIQRYIQQHNEVELSALGMAITTVVTIAEILKNNGLAIEKKVSTSTVNMKDENKGRVVLKAKIEIVLGKSDKFDLFMNASNVAPETDTKSKE